MSSVYDEKRQNIKLVSARHLLIMKDWLAWAKLYL